MSIDSPATYGEWYWKQSVEATLAEHKASEKELSGLASRLIASLSLKEHLPDELQFLISEIEAPAGAFLGDVGGRFVSEVADGAVSQSCSPFFDALKYKVYSALPTKKMSPASTTTLFSRGKITEELFLERYRMEGFEPLEAKFQYDAMRAYPSIPDIMRWSRYFGDPNNIRGKVWERLDVDESDFDMWEWLSLQKLSTEQCQTLLKRGVMSDGEFYNEIAQIGWTITDRAAIQELAYTLPNAMLLVQGNLFNNIPDEKILDDISMADIHPKYAQTYLDAILTKPASQDVVAYELRQDATLSRLGNQLRKIGIHPAYFDMYKELAYQIPPVADIITMAVREAFSPDIAARFGQYQDFPPDFERYAGMKGLSPEWAQRYWAAHWNLPSPQQGFEMLHRGVINRDELNVLLRALDVMPYWRDKLVKIAYRPLTRVDVRRMYKEGVLTEKEVYESYLEQGYDSKNAERMANFTVLQTLSSLSKFTSSDIVKAFTDRMISKSDAMSLLSLIGIRTEDANYIVATAEYKRQWAFTDQQIAGIKNLYKKQVYSNNETMDKLAKLNLPSDQINVLMQQWYYEIEAVPSETWTAAQTLSFYKKGLISSERAKRELLLNGYDDEHIKVYLQSVEPA